MSPWELQQETKGILRVHGYFLIWFVLQVGNAKPEIQKVVDALNSIETKVIFAVCVDWHQSQLCYVAFFRKWIFYFFLVYCV